MALFGKFFGKSKIDPNDLEAVVNAYGKVLGQSSSVIRQESELPLPKGQLRAALWKAIELTPAGPIREQLKSGYVMLGDFQDLDACKREGRDPSNVMVAEAEQLLADLKKAGL